jgi:uncharacterized repeat protein (TIGR03803 family)
MDGTVFAYNPSTGGETVVHNFPDPTVPSDGYSPDFGNLVLLSGSGTPCIYGTTTKGGAHGYGTVFEIKDPGSPNQIYSVIYSFAASGLTCPESLMQASDGNFYGTASAGPNGQGDGGVFRLSPAGALTPVHTFTGSPSDGAAPWGPLIQATNGNLYGTTGGGGVANEGTIYQLTLAGAEIVLHNFADGTMPNDGEQPPCGLMQASDGNLYGVTYYGGVYGNGVIYECGP